MLLKLKSSFTFGSIKTPRRKRSQEPIIRRNGPARSEWRCRHRLGLEVSPRRIPCSLPARLTSAQQIKIEEASGTLKKKSPILASSLLASRRAALGQDRASMAILERYRHASSRPLRALSVRQGAYPSHLAASFSTVPSSWSFLMASLMALVSSGLSLFTATAYSSPVATSRTTWASL